MTRFHWLILALGMMGLSSVALVGCGDENEQASCREDSDCGAGELCVNGTCAEVCFTADDCSNPNQGCSGLCPEANQPICFFECTSDDDCGENEFCNTEFCNGSFGRCENIGVDECLSNDDCGDGQYCNIITRQCETACEEHADCEDGFLCHSESGVCIASGAACIDDDGCGDGEVCEDEVCVPEGDASCDDVSDCYDLGDFYCGAFDDGNQCVSTACGSAVNDCSRCILGANNGSRNENGPVIFFAEQVPVSSGQWCEPNSANCGEGAKLFCKFSFHYFDPDNDYSPSNSNLFVVSGRGTTSTTFGVRNIGSGIAEFGACFPDGVNTPGTAIFVRDAANNASNTLCTTGRR